MARWGRMVLLGGLLAAEIWWLAAGSAARATTQLMAGTASEVDDTTTQEILTMFQQADKAAEKRDLNGVMALYSERYNYHGLKKADIRKLWSDLFAHYEQIEATHLFTRIVRGGAGDVVEVTCSGGVRALSVPGRLRVPIDSWYGEIHYLVREDGRWKILGNAGDVQTILPFGTAPHPLF